MAGADGSALSRRPATGYLSLPAITPAMPTIVATPLARKTANRPNPRTCSQSAPF